MDAKPAKLYRAFYKSPIGRIEITATDKEIRSLDFVKGKASGRADALSPALRACLKQLDEVFRRPTPDLRAHAPPRGIGVPMATSGRRCSTSPYGTTVSYADVAKSP